ncbi:hypothetical protein G4960_07700 [Blautia obeum]|uniref:hypothetical protein n=1 Tax=Blautia obeum TaxID=40520 RepID=UPI00156D821A|nr:hypothetical protein [Blautia obeum]NSG39673.1 hypothetical protein [Blautia obeum]
MFHKGRKVKKSKKKKIISLIVVVAVAGTSGAVVYRKVSGRWQQPQKSARYRQQK